MGHNLVAPGVDDLGVIRDQPEGFGDTQIELPDSLAPTNHTDFRPVPIRDDLTGWIATGEKCSPIAAIKGFEVLTRTDRVLLRHRLRSIPWLLLPMQSRSPGLEAASGRSPARWLRTLSSPNAGRSRSYSARRATLAASSRSSQSHALIARPSRNSASALHPESSSRPLSFPRA